MVLISPCNSQVGVQTDSLDILNCITDTSYFKPGNDDVNLLESVIRNHPANTLFLLKRGADPDATSGEGKSALIHAVETGDTLIIKLLVLNGADLELCRLEKTTPLMVAVLNSQFEAAHFLLIKGANPDHQDLYGATSLIYSAAMNDYAMADLLLFFGASDTLKEKQGNDALMTAVCMGNLESTDVLLQNGIGPDSRDNKLNTPLMIAAQQGNTDMISLLLEHQADPELENSDSYTALAHASRTGEVGVAKILVDSGANIHHNISNKQNIYDLAAEQKEEEIIKLLKTQGASPLPSPDFSEFGFGWGNSFANNEYMMQGRLWWQDRKFGYFIETGFDIRPTTRFVHVEINDTLIHQYRENRSAWTHGAGKYFTLIRNAQNIEYGFYGAVYGMLSFPTYRGISDRPSPSYNLVPSAGLFLRGQLAGIKSGIERYTFRTFLEGRWKMNITIFIRIPYKNSRYTYKEIRYD